MQWKSKKRLRSSSEEIVERAMGEEMVLVQDGGISHLPSSDNGGHIWFYEDVTPSSAAHFSERLHRAESKRRHQAIECELEEPRPIHIHIHSMGGDVFAGFAIADCITNCKVPVHTHIEGGAMSAATFFSICGAHRTIGPNGFVLIHQLSGEFEGKYEELRDMAVNNDLMMDRIRKMYSSYTHMTEEQIESILKQELWLDAEKALEYGIVDEIVG